MQPYIRIFIEAFASNRQDTHWGFERGETGLFWGLTIWAMYWLFQEWFIYNTLLGESLLLNVLELILLLSGSLVEGIVIAFFLARKPQRVELHSRHE